MATSRRVATLLLAVDAGRWWVADSACIGLRSALKRLDKRWYRFYQVALSHLDGAPVVPPADKPMSRLLRCDHDRAEWESLVARLTQDAERDRPWPP